MRRLIFTLLYDRGQFMLSRNFRLQAVGTIDWLFDNYDFAQVSRGLDELMVLDVTRGERDTGGFSQAVSRIAERCFIPVTVGGGITSFEIAQRYMRSGGDKLLVNTAFQTDPDLCRALARHFGRQCVIAGIDYRTAFDGSRAVVTHNGAVPAVSRLSEWVQQVQDIGAGEILFQSIEQDGTGMGLDLRVVDDLPFHPDMPCILMGGVGKAEHVVAGLRHPTVDAVATANLFNFIGSAFLNVRQTVAAAGLDVAQWRGDDYGIFHQKFSVTA